MSSPIMGKDDPGDGNRPSNSRTSDKTIQLNKIVRNQNGVCALDVGKQQLQNLQGCNVFILSPTQLKNLGLVAKMKNGKPVIMQESKGGSTTENITETISVNQLVPLLESKIVSPDTVAVERVNVNNAERHLEMVEFAAKSHSLKDSAIVTENKEKSMQYVKMSGGVKRKRIVETAGSEQKQPELLKIKDSSEDGSMVNSGDKDTSVVSGDSVPKSMQLWRYETQRHLPRFAVHWQLALAEIGYINCPMMECNYISLSEADMFSHYSHCDGKPSIAGNTCPICMCRLGTENDLKTHMLRSHPGDGFHRKTLQQVMIKNKWEVRPKVKLLAKRRSFCKVHRVSWNIAIESKGYVKCLFQNCSYLAITVDEMIKHYGICNGGGDIGAYPYPYKCSHCGGCVETEEKLQAHIEKSHTTEHSSYQTKLLPSSSKTIKKEKVLPTIELVKPIKLETKENKDSSYCQDSFIITLNASDGNYTDDKHIQLVSVDKIKTEVGTADCYEHDGRVQNIYPSDNAELHHSTTFPLANIKSCPTSEMLSINQVQTWVDSTASEELSDTQEEQKVANIRDVKETYCQKKERAVDIVIERMEKRVNPGSTVPEDIPDVSIQCVEPVPFTVRRESGLNSEQIPDVSICTTEKPLDCVSTETDLKQRTYLENHLFSSDLSSSEQSDDIDVKPDIIENDTLSHLNMHRVKQYSSIYSGDSYKGRFYRRMHSKDSFDDDTFGAKVTKGLDGCKNMEHHLVNDDHGVGSRSVLKTYSRRTLRVHSNATASGFSNKSLKEVTWLKKAESDSTARHLNEPLDQCGGPGTFHDNCSVDNTNASHLRDTGSTGLYSIVDEQCQVDSDVGEEFENSQNAQKSRSSSGATLVLKEISELVSSSECVNNMETSVCTMRDTEGMQSERKIDTSAVITSCVTEGKSEQHVSSQCVDVMENDVSTLMDTEILQSGRRRNTSTVGTDFVPEGKSEHTVSSECVDAMDNDVCAVKDAQILQSVRRRNTSTVELDSVPEGSSEHSVTTECVDTMVTHVSIIKDTEVVQSVMRRDTSLDGPDSVLQGNSEYRDSSECVDAMEADANTVKNTELQHSERKRDTISVKPDSVPEGSSEHSVSSDCVDNMVANVSSMNDTEVLESGRRYDINSVRTGHVSEGTLECHAGSVCVDAMEADVSTVKNTEVLHSERRMDTISVKPDSVPEGSSEHSFGSDCVDNMVADVSTMNDTEVLESGRRYDINSVRTGHVSEGTLECHAGSVCVDAMDTEVSTVKDTEVLQSGRRKDSSSIGPESAPEGHMEHSVSSEFMDAMETEDSPVQDTEVLQSEMRNTVSVEPDSVPEVKSEHNVSSECVDAMEVDVSTMNDTEALYSDSRTDTNSVECDGVADGKVECHAGSMCVDAMDTEVNTVKDTEIIVFKKKRATPSTGTADVREGNSKHQATSEFMHVVENDINTVKDTNLVQSERRKDRLSTGTTSVSEGNLARCASSECVDAVETNVSAVMDEKIGQSGKRRGRPPKATASVMVGGFEFVSVPGCVDTMQTNVSTVKDIEGVQSGTRRGTTSRGTASVPEQNLAHCASSECVNAMDTNVSTVKDIEGVQSGTRRGTTSRGTASVPEQNLAHCASSECVNAMDTNVSTVKDIEGVQSGTRRGTTSRGTASVPEQNLAHCASSECVNAMDTNVSTVKDIEGVQSGTRRGTTSRGTASVPEQNLAHCASSECVNAMDTNVSTVKDIEGVQSGTRRGTTSRGTASVPEQNLAHCASSECVNAMDTNVSTVKDIEGVQSGTRRGTTSRGTASVPEQNLAHCASSECVNAMDTNVSTVKDIEGVQSGTRRGTTSRGTASVPEQNLAHCASSECVNAMDTNVSTVKDIEGVQSGTRRGTTSRGTASVPEQNLAHCASSECVNAMDTNVSTVKDTEVVQSGRRRGRPPKVTASVPEGNSEHCASSERMDAMETDASTMKDTQVVRSGRRRGRPPKVTASVPEGNSEHCASSECVDALETDASTVKDTQVVRSGRRRGRPPKVTASVPEGNSEHCASSECVDALETDASTVKDTQVVRSGRRRGRPPKVTASVPEGNLEHCASSECMDAMETDASTVKDTQVVRSGRRRGRPPKVTASVPEGNLEHCASSECVDAMETNVIAVKDTGVVRSGRRRGRPPKVMANVTEGRLEAISIPQYVDSMDTDDNILGGTNRQQNGQSVRSRRGRGRSRGRGYRGRCRNSLAQLVLRKERQLEQSAEGDSLLEVKCAKCSEEMQKKFFERHNRVKHCGLGWIEGTDPIDLNDEKLLTRILTKVHHAAKWLTCETCGANKRSVVGYISHLQCCQKSVEERQMMKMPCEICGRSMLPVSLKVHMSTVHKNPPKVEEVLTLEELETLSKMKRAAATKAVSRIQEFIGDEDVVEGNEKASRQYDGLYLKVRSRRINNFICASWKRALGQLGKVCCRHIGCTIESKTFEEAQEHYLNCSMAPKKGYVCRKCSFHCEEEPEMLSHVTSEHGHSPGCSDNSDADSESELETEDEEKSAAKKPKTAYSAASKNKAYTRMRISNKMKFLLRESSGPVIGDKPYVPAVKWTLTFHLENYMQSLYPNIHSTSDDWVALTSAAAAQYLPHTEESVEISRLCMKRKVLLYPHKAVKQWKRLKLFEAEVIDGIPMFFAGGPVWAMAWCPLPLQNTIYRTAHINQYLAVSCHSGMEDTYISGQSYSHSGLIQIWDFGHLDNQQPCSTPKLAVGIAHDYGAVWCMEWCPSGCYDTLDVEVPKCRLRRLGLLGAACSDGTVRIFSVCFPTELQDKICGSIPIFKVEAVRTLVLDDRQTCLLGDSKWQCTRLSWYKGKGHRIIAGSFTNGMVALWDIATESPLLSKRVGKSCILYPYHSFQAHIGVVSAIALSPQDDGRYLMTGSFDRTTKYWDLENTSAPITVSKRGSVTDGVWLTHWVSAVNSFDDSYSLGHANGTLAPVRQFGFCSYPLLSQNSVAWSVSSCDWMNAVAQSTLAGELTVIFSHQLLIGVDTEKGMREKRMIISYTDIMDMEEQKEEGCKKGDVTEKPHTSQHFAGDGLPNEHDMDVDRSSGDRKSQLSFEDMFPKLESRGSVPVLQEGSSAGNMDVNVIDNCDVSISNSDNARTDGPNTEFRSVVQSPNESLTVSVQSDVESKESAITRNITHSTLTDSVTLTEKCKNVSVSSRTSDLSQYDLSVTDSADAERSFSMESSVAIESMSKADESMKNNVDSPEKMDHDSDKTRESSGVEVMSYEQAHTKCGLILCDFPTDNLKQMPHEARWWMRQSDKMRTVGVKAYPIGSINRVSWNPNCRSFLWLAAGYHCGLVRVPCMKAMYCKPIEDILQHGEHKVAALLNNVSEDLQCADYPSSNTT